MGRLLIFSLFVCGHVAGQTLTTVAVFDSTNGGITQPLTKGADGNFYGVTGYNAAGIFYKVSPAGVFTQIATLGPTSTNDIYAPNTSLTLGTDGNFYGIGLLGGSGKGGIFKITPAGVRTSLYLFSSQIYTAISNGYGGMPALTLGKDGNFYGETAGGGKNGSGTVFMVTPKGQLTVLYDIPSNAAGGARGSHWGRTAIFMTCFLSKQGLFQTLSSCSSSIPRASQRKSRRSRFCPRVLWCLGQMGTSTG